ncbi:MAG: hypothetical protein KJ069_17475 [Anaerolineae bacterium]|nr:hypothetical protein [Anaerolineae bacterium]
MNPNSLEKVLQEIALDQRPYPDFSVQYDDVHGLWGGDWLRVSGDGQYEHHRRERGTPEPTVTHGPIAASDIRALARLLVELEAWQQITPDRTPLPDESRATLTVQVADTAVTIWEWYNEMERNGRIVGIRDRMLALTKPVRL